MGKVFSRMFFVPPRLTGIPTGRNNFRYINVPSVKHLFRQIYIFDTKKCRILPMVGGGGSVHPAVGTAARHSGQTRYFHPALKKSPKNPRIF